MYEIEIFKAGTHTSSSGVKKTYTVDELQLTVDDYNARVAEGGDANKAPLVIGHPKDDSLAHGWFDSLSLDRESGLMKGKVSQVSDFAIAQVRGGGLKRFSSSFYSGVFPKFRHGGLLGAMAPAVKGLAPVNFSDGTETVLEYGDYDDVQNAGLWRNLREWFIGKFGQDEADKVIPGYTVGSLEVAAATETADESPAFAEAPEPALAAAPVMAPAVEPAPAIAAEQNPVVQVTAEATPVVSAKPLDFAEQEARIAARESELAERESALRDAEIASFCEGVIGSGRVLPSMRGTVTTLLKTLETSTADFAEGNAQASPAELLKTLLSSLPPVVTYSEVATDETGPAPTHLDFAVAPGYTVDAADVAKLQRAQAYQAQHPELTLIQAFSKI
jgi:hypothetical protein